MQTPNSAFVRQWWDNVVTLGAQGYVRAGEGRMRQLSDAFRGTDPVVASLCASTRASWIRQAGRHSDAATVDGAAASFAFAGTDADPSASTVAALGDALTGLAADNLGIGRFGASGRLLNRVEEEVLPAIGSDAGFIFGDRIHLRWCWVSTELALYRGDFAAAVEHSGRGVDAARSVPSERHRIKTDLIAAATSAANDDVDTARALAASCARRCAGNGLLPLRWAALTMLSGMADQAGQREGEREGVGTELADIATELRRRGMYM
ncbi:hypothetical protein [Gordonia sp. CPCC 205333]|uniref:hypothetical protein n=1 Tax=Gordonia sp. CPCC 205333 TaxID=3140790 RepID=UPI003AF37288